MHRSGVCRDPASCPVGVEHVPSALLPCDPNMYWRLTEEETVLLTKLTNAYMAAGLHKNFVRLTSVASLSCDRVIEAVDQMAGDLVAFFTAMPDFASLHHKDQVAVLTANGMPIFLLRNGFAASLNADHGPHSTGHMPLNADHGPHSTGHMPLNADHGPHSTDHMPLNADHGPHSTDHMPLNADHGPHSTGHMPLNADSSSDNAAAVVVPERLMAEGQQGAASANATAEQRQIGEALVGRLCELQCTLRPILRNDVTTAAILQCVVVFDASAPLVGDRQTVCILADKYEILLRHYVESQCSYLFSWQYLERMYHLRRQSRALAKDLIQQFHSWGSILDTFLHKLTDPEVRNE